MKLQQLRYLWEVHRHGNHISAAAETLHCRSMVQRPIEVVLAQAQATAAADHPLAQEA